MEVGVWGAGLRVWGTGFRVQVAGCRVQGSRFGVQGSGFGVQGAGFRVQGAGCRVQGLGCRDQGLGVPRHCQAVEGWGAGLRRCGVQDGAEYQCKGKRRHGRLECESAVKVADCVCLIALDKLPSSPPLSSEYGTYKTVKARVCFRSGSGAMGFSSAKPCRHFLS